MRMPKMFNVSIWKNKWRGHVVFVLMLCCLLTMGLRYHLDIAHMIDDIVTAIKVVDWEHHEIHEGDHYFLTVPLTLAEDAVANTLITTPDTAKQIHVKFVTDSTTDLDIKFYEGTDRVGSGGTVTPTNSNRSSSNTSGLTIHGAITGGTTDGTLIAHFDIGQAGSPPSAGNAGGGARSAEEIVLDRNTKYLLVLTSGDDDNKINTLVVWYEHTPDDNDYWVRSIK